MHLTHVEPVCINGLLKELHKSDSDRALNKEVLELRKVVYAGFVLIAAELDMTRNVGRRTISKNASEKEATDVRRQETRRSEHRSRRPQINGRSHVDLTFLFHPELYLHIDSCFQGGGIEWLANVVNCANS